MQSPFKVNHMKYQIDTVPIWDAYLAEPFCPLCLLLLQEEERVIDRSLGASVMEPDERIQVNEMGFCSYHQQLLYAKQNRLGQALMMQSHLIEEEKKMNHLLSASPVKRSFFARKETGTVENKKTCISCSRLEHKINQHIYSLLNLWQKDKAFQEAFLKSNGFCLPHLRLICAMAKETMSAGKQADFFDALKIVQNNKMQTVREKLDVFINSFDWRNAGKPLNDARTALEDAVNMASGFSVGESPLKNVK